MRGMLRTGARVLAFAALALLLSGCLKLDEHLTLKPDNTVDGTVTFGVSKQMIQMTGQSADDVLSQMTQSDSPVPSGVANVQTSDYSDDQFVGKTYTFSDATLDQINGQGADLTIKRDGETFVVDGALDLSSGTQSGIDLNDPTTKSLLQSFQVSVAITFPGAVTDPGSGAVDGNTVTWTPKIGETTQIHAVGSAIASSSSNLWLYVLIGVVVLLVVIVLVVLASRRNKAVPASMTGFETTPEAASAPEGAPASAAPGGEPGTPAMTEPATTEPRRPSPRRPSPRPPSPRPPSPRRPSPPRPSP